MKKILIISDDIVEIDILKKLFLQKNEFKIYEAQTLVQLKELIKKYEFFIAIYNTSLANIKYEAISNILLKKNIPTILLKSSIEDDFPKNPNIVDYVFNDSVYGLEIVHKMVELVDFMEDVEILLIEERADSIMKIKSILEPLLLKVVVAKNSFEALEELNKNKNISLIISDYSIPKINGLDLVKNIRKNSDYYSIPIIVLTSGYDKELKIEFLKNGVNDLLLKPILEEELKFKIFGVFSNLKAIEDIRSFDKIVDENIILSSTDLHGVIREVSSAFVKISGYSKDELIGNKHNLVRHPSMPRSIYKEIWNTITKGKTWKGEIKNKTKNNEDYWVNTIIEPVFDKHGKIIRYQSIRQDITDKKKIYELSIKDGLTGLYNRGYFNEIANSILKKTVRNGSFVSFMILDIDNFKKFNDTYGHQEGDEVLINVSKSLKKSFKRNNDFVFRLGGEEFGVLFNTKTIKNTLSLVEKARKSIVSLNIKHSENPPLEVITASFGLAIIPFSKIENKNINITSIYKKADKYLYKAKENGKNKIEYLVL